LLEQRHPRRGVPLLRSGTRPKESSGCARMSSMRCLDPAMTSGPEDHLTATRSGQAAAGPTA
jgi:hypothetical protein